MKSILMTAWLLLVTVMGWCQDTEEPQTAEDFYKQSKLRNQAGWVLLGGGAALGLAGLIIPMGDPIEENCWFWCKYENEDLKLTLFLTGGVAMVTSIPVFIASGRSYQKGLRLEMKTKRTDLPVRFRNIPSHFPAVQLTLNL